MRSGAYARLLTYVLGVVGLAALAGWALWRVVDATWVDGPLMAGVIALITIAAIMAASLRNRDR